MLNAIPALQDVEVGPAWLMGRHAKMTKEQQRLRVYSKAGHKLVTISKPQQITGRSSNIETLFRSQNPIHGRVASVREAGWIAQAWSMFPILGPRTCRWFLIDICTVSI